MPFSKLKLNGPIVLNRNYIRSPVGIVKIAECLFGLVSWMSIWLSCRRNYDPYFETYSGLIGGDVEVFVFLIHFTFLFISTFLITVYYFSIITSTIIPKTVFEMSYNFIAFALLLISSLCLFIIVIQRNQQLDGFGYEPGYGGKITSSIFGLFNSIAYSVDTYFSYKSYIQS